MKKIQNRQEANYYFDKITNQLNPIFMMKKLKDLKINQVLHQEYFYIIIDLNHYRVI